MCVTDDNGSRVPVREICKQRDNDNMHNSAEPLLPVAAAGVRVPHGEAVGGAHQRDTGDRTA